MPEGKFGPYQLEALLGRGGMGEVHRAYDTRRKRVVALKLLAPHRADDPAFVARFRRESELAARLSEPHVVPIHDFGEIDGRLYIDMRLVEGIDLHKLISEEGALPPERAVALVRQVAGALDAAHAAGLLHRDIKPSNLLLVHDEGPDFVYLADFGIVGEVDATDGKKITATGVALGTAAYMAPERFDGMGDHRADVYALGCVLHELLNRQAALRRRLLHRDDGHAHSLGAAEAVGGRPAAGVRHRHRDGAGEVAGPALPQRRRAGRRRAGGADRARADGGAHRAGAGRRPALPAAPPPVQPLATRPDEAAPALPPRRRVRRGIVATAGGLVLVAAAVTAIVLSSGPPTTIGTPGPLAAPTSQPAIPVVPPAEAAATPSTSELEFTEVDAPPPPAPKHTNDARKPIAKADLAAQLSPIAKSTHPSYEVMGVACDGDLPSDGIQTCTVSLKQKGAYASSTSVATLTRNTSAGPGDLAFNVVWGAVE